MVLLFLDRLIIHESSVIIHGQRTPCTWLGRDKRDDHVEEDMELFEMFLPKYFGVNLKLHLHSSNDVN